MKIELIVPAVEENARVPNLALPILAGLTPADYRRVKNEGRLVRDRSRLLEKQEDFAPHFLPTKMSAETLREGWKKAWQDFYSFPSIWRRFYWEYSPTLINGISYFPFQLMQHRFTKEEILGGRQSGSQALECGSFRLWGIIGCIKFNVFMHLIRTDPSV